MPLKTILPIRSPVSGTPLRQGIVSPLSLMSASRVARTAAIAIAETPAPFASARLRLSSTIKFKMAPSRS